MPQFPELKESASCLEPYRQQILPLQLLKTPSTNRNASGSSQVIPHHDHSNQ